MSELPEGIEPARPPRPRDSALGVVVRHTRAGVWECLLGLRHRRSRFMPGHLAFPGGRLEPVDEPARPGSFERCVAREVLEETGLAIPAGRWCAAGARITPPIFPVRFNARFFVAEAPEDYRAPDKPPAPDEIERVDFMTARAAMAAWEGGQALLPPPVLPVLRALEQTDARDVRRLAEHVVQVNLREQSSPRIEFVPGIWMLPVSTATLPPATHTNVWLPGRDRFVVIDPGAGDPAELDRLLAVIERRRAAGGEPQAVLLTHHHGDHVRGAGELARALGVAVRAHPETLERVEVDAGVAAEELRDGQQLELGDTPLVALHTPGHAPGHLAFHLPGRAAVVSGDLVSGLSTILIDPDEGDMGQYLAALRRVAQLGARHVLPAHGPPLPGRAISELIRHRLDREAKVLGAIADTATSLAEIARRAYDDVPRMPAALTQRQAEAHLLHLQAQGRARRAAAAGELWSRMPSGGGP